MKSRCRCHPADIYGGCVECPRCGHWSMDPGIGCERRACAFVPSDAPTLPFDAPATMTDTAAL